jgi:hypothetical protein
MIVALPILCLCHPSMDLSTKRSLAFIVINGAWPRSLCNNRLNGPSGYFVIILELSREYSALPLPGYAPLELVLRPLTMGLAQDVI